MEEKDHKTRYTRLDSSHFSGEENKTDEKKSVANSMDLIYIKIQSFVWVLISIILLIFTDFLPHLVNEDGSSVSLFFTVFFFTVSIILLLYSVVYIPYILKISLPCSVYSPNIIPFSCFGWIGFFISLSVYYWTFYGFLSPFLILFILMGLLNLSHFIPSSSFFSSSSSASPSPIPSTGSTASASFPTSAPFSSSST